MTFYQLAVFFEKIEKTKSRLEITEILAELFRKLAPEEIDKTAYLLQGRVAPIYEKTEFGMAEKTVIKSAIIALNLDKSYFEKENKETGDLGITVEKFKHQIRSFEEKKLTIKEVYDQLLFLALASGPGSQEVKQNCLSNLIRQLDPLSCRYLVRIPQGLMRLGFSDMTVLDAFSWMIKSDKTLRPEIERAYHVRPDLGYIGKLLKEKGIGAIKNIQPKLFTPIIMMRAERLSSGKEIISQIGRCAIEPKYDGFRLQAHYLKEKRQVKLYSRSLDDVSFMYPDLTEAIIDQIMAQEIIFEGEAVGFDPKTGSFLPFQETVQRKRKYMIKEKTKAIPLKFYVFELLYKNGVNFLKQPFIKRRKALEESIKPANKIILLTPQQIVGDYGEIERLFDQTVKTNLEGILAKKLNGIYQPGARGWNWIKLKKSYSSKVEDTIDCLIMGYDLGRGKRTAFGIGAFLVGIYDQQQDKFVTVAKIGTGLTDEEWKKLKIKSQKLKVKDIPPNYLIDKAMNCDVWLKPRLIVEIRADEITRSPVHTAGRQLKPSKTGQAEEVSVPGFALRFPRLERFRDDKNPQEATSLKEVEKMFQRQKNNQEMS